MSTPKTHKTPQLMKMLTGMPASNPILDEEFKEEIIKAGEETQSVTPVKGKDGRTQINVTSELVSLWLPKVIERFNICKCERCRAEITIRAMDDIRPIIVKVRSDGDLERAARLKADRQHMVLMQLIGIAAERRSMRRHD
ncbi:MAG: hypothetical protein NC078_09400 [Ruminococcus sp.]|nr:hypothetical protein [Ruminococcus sp.]